MRFHYYDNNGNTFLSKFDAGNNPKLYFYDKEFSSANWLCEPKESLQSLYLQRAQQLRDNYKYIILAYSGGIDSTTILETFFYNNLHIDEIIVVGALSQDSFEGSDENHNGELYYNCFPTLNSLKLKGTKITVCDYSLLFDKPQNLSMFNSLETKHNVLDVWMSPHHWWWHELEKQFDIENACVIFGVDKPVYNWDSDLRRGFFEFPSNLVSFYGHRPSYKQQYKLNREFFYWTPDLPQILIKQLYVVDSFFKSHVLTNTIPSYQFFNEQTKIVNRLVYSELKNKLVFVAPKSKSTIFSLRDKFLLKKQSSEIYKDFVKFFDWLKINKPSNFVTNKDGVMVGKICKSKRYYLK